MYVYKNRSSTIFKSNKKYENVMKIITLLCDCIGWSKHPTVTIKVLQWITQEPKANKK